MLASPPPGRPDLICFSHLRWDFVYQRPQHLLSRAARSFNVLFVEEPVFVQDQPAQLETQARGHVTVLVPHLPEGCPSVAEELASLLRAYLAEHDAAGRVLWFYTPQAVTFTRDILADLVIYDNMDELSAFLGAPASLLELEDELFSRADLIFTGGVSLYEAKRQRHHSVHAFPSSVDAAHFGKARDGIAEPQDQRSIPGPRIGFFGVIDERMDVALVEALADRRPDYHFVMIGPVVKIAPSSLPRRQNIHWLGPKPYSQLPDYLSGWDCGFMPFALNEATRFISPTKTPEFLAAGLRVTSTPIADVVRPYGEKNLVRIASDADEMADALEALLTSRTSRMGAAQWAKAVDAHLADMSWDSTWAAMGALMAETIAPRLGAPRRAPAALAGGRESRWAPRVVADPR